MNYLTEIKMFNEWLETNELSTSGIALWYALMYIANRSGWKLELSIPISALCLRTKLSRSAIYKERNVLRDHGLVDFDAGDGRQSSTYKIHSFESRLVSTVISTSRTQMETQAENPDAETEEVSTVASTTTTQPCTLNEESGDESTVTSTTRTQECTQDEVVSTTRTQPWTIYKHKQDISIDKDKKIDKGGSGEKRKSGKASKKSKTEFDLSFIDDSGWESLVRTWLDYKHSRREDYKSELSVRKFLTMLRNYSGGDTATAQKIIDKSIANNWAGIFELNAATGSSSAKPASGQHIGQIIQPASDDRRQRLLQKFDKK